MGRNMQAGGGTCETAGAVDVSTLARVAHVTECVIAVLHRPMLEQVLVLKLMPLAVTANLDLAFDEADSQPSLSTKSLYRESTYRLACHEQLSRRENEICIAGSPCVAYSE
jgi:hypothetical protein